MLLLELLKFRELLLLLQLSCLLPGIRLSLVLHVRLICLLLCRREGRPQLRRHLRLLLLLLRWSRLSSIRRLVVLIPNHPAGDAL